MLKSETDKIHYSFTYDPRGTRGKFRNRTRKFFEMRGKKRKEKKEEKRKKGKRSQVKQRKKRERKKGWKVYFAFPERASLN